MRSFPIVLLYAAALGLAYWAGAGGTLPLVLPALFLGAALLLGVRGEGVREGVLRARGVALGSALLVLGVVVGFSAEAHLARISAQWEPTARDREREVRDRLAQALDGVLEASETGAARLVQLPLSPLSGEGLSGIPVGTRPPGVDALAIFGPAGELVAWDGHHQGPIPRAARLGLVPYLYRESALFGYLYVTRALPDGVGTAVAASLLRSDLPASLAGTASDFVSRFSRVGGGRIQIARPDRLDAESIWDFRWEGDVLFSVSHVPESQDEVRDRVRSWWRGLVLLLLFLAWGAVTRGSRWLPGSGALGAGALVAIVGLLPVRALFGSPRIFSPADFLLPGPLPLTLGALLTAAATGVVALGVLRLSSPRRFPPLLAALVGAAVALWPLRLLGEGASRDLLASPDALWTMVPATAVLLLTLLWAPVALPRPLAPPSGASDRGAPMPALRTGWMTLSVVLSALLGFSVALVANRAGAVPLWAAGLWVLPLLALAQANVRGPMKPGLRMRLALLVATGTLALSWGWGLRVEARMIEAEARVARLGVRPDPFLEFLLFRWAEEVGNLSGSGRDLVELLYGAWTGSGLAREGVPVWLTGWTAEGVPGEELRIGVSGTRPPLPPELLLTNGFGNESRIRPLDRADAQYVMAVPVRDGWVTAILPPRRGISRDSPLGPLFSPAQGEPDPLALVPLAANESVAIGDTPEVRWIATPDGWRGEVILAYPDQMYRGHLTLRLPGPLLLLARGALLFLVGGLALLLLEGVGARLVADDRIQWRRSGRALASFRGRVTLALFGFFLIPTVLFGVLADRTLSAASLRTAETLAERAARDAGGWFADAGGAMDLLASRVGSDLLLYEEGQLAAGSQRELVELGLYEGWLPPSVHRELAEGARLLTTASASLGGWRYVVAYQRLPGGQVLAAPAPLQAGATAVRQREIADLLLFALFLGGAFSILLALLVGRALSRPIQTLQVASERVGSGNMRVHLPEDRGDEFGAVFGAFNRMVDGLARTRRALLRSSRRTRTIVEEVATGLIAVDPQGRVTLANPRAEAFIGGSLPRHVGILGSTPAGSGVRVELARWVEAFLAEGTEEGTTELASGDRRFRVQARRIPGKGEGGGAVLALEDVTDELRTERILAWGEMAQQVAHEVKNPLTPMKLGVQHIRRAWEAGSPDFDRILARNVDAILIEIDRLAGIATSFSRFAAPARLGVEPLEAVNLEGVIQEVMALYGAGEGPVLFRAVLAPELPPVVGRAREVKEVLVNLLENARAVLPDGGEVEIRVVRHTEPDALQVEVLDTGPGIPSDLLPRIFEPHFSTRSSGTGLGLAIVRRLVASWGGSVRAENRGEGGVRVAFRMQLWDKAVIEGQVKP